MYICKDVCGSFAELLEQVKVLAQTGYVKTGNWSLGQICEHLARAIDGSAKPASEGSVEWNVSFFKGLRMKLVKILLLSFRMAPDHVSAPEGLDVVEPVSDDDGLNHLKSAIDKFSECKEPQKIHRILGPFSREEWIRFHLIHAGMHLRFLKKNQG